MAFPLLLDKDINTQNITPIPNLKRFDQCNPIPVFAERAF
jgi:hypothetical protein